jgi:hypothetical protein
MTIFAAMKINLKILLRIIFMLVVFFNLGTDGYSTCSIQLYNSEQSTRSDDSGNSFSSDADSFHEDQIDQMSGLEIKDESVIQGTEQQVSSTIYNLYISVWQPPKFF